MIPFGFPMRKQRRRQKAPSALWLRSKLWAHRQRMVRARLTVLRVRLLITRPPVILLLGHRLSHDLSMAWPELPQTAKLFGNVPLQEDAMPSCRLSQLMHMNVLGCTVWGMGLVLVTAVM